MTLWKRSNLLAAPEARISGAQAETGPRQGMAAVEERIEMCPVCRSHAYVPFFRLDDVPVQDGVLWNSREEALAAPVGNICLAYCRRCGYIGNLLFDRNKIRYDHEYSFSLHYSPTYQGFMTALATRLVATYGLSNARVLEIGCGQGDFLRLLCEMAGTHGIGIDPSIAPRVEKSGSAEITFLQDLYTARYADLDCQFIACRQVLDQLADPRAFVETVRQNIGKRQQTVVYFEVPNATNIFEEMLVRNIMYEKTSWFTVESLTRLFELSGFSVLSAEPCFDDGQYIGIEATAVADREPVPLMSGDEPEGLGDAVAAFAANYEQKIRAWQGEFQAIRESGRKAIAWGAGSGAIHFFSALGIKDEIPYVVDVNPKRQGRFLPHTGQEVVAPEYIREFGTDLVIITNATYQAEIRQQVAALGVDSAFWVV
jgi:SAM-dependent methyltransferase